MAFENYPFEQRRLVVNEIRQLLRQDIFEKQDHVLKIDSGVTIIKNAPFKKAQNIFKHYLWQHVEDALKFKISVAIDLSQFIVTFHKNNHAELITDEKELITMLPYSLADSIGNRIFELLIVSQIARPGSLKLRDGIIWINGVRRSEIVPQIMNSREAMELHTKIGYPQIAFMKLTDLYIWIVNNDLLYKDVPNNPYQQVLNCLSYIQGDQSQIQ
jgi:hypothetical protein